jgi:hypothetical protein
MVLNFPQALLICLAGFGFTIEGAEAQGAERKRLIIRGAGLTRPKEKLSSFFKLPL